MDNVKFHRKEILQKLVKSVGANVIFLPSYSPDFNSIERSWTNLKRWLKDNWKSFLFFDFAVHHYFYCNYLN